MITISQRHRRDGGGRRRESALVRGTAPAAANKTGYP